MPRTAAAAVESPLWCLVRPLAVLYVAAFVAAAVLGLRGHTTAAAVVLGASNGAALLWVVALITAAAGFTRRDGAR